MVLDLIRQYLEQYKEYLTSDSKRDKGEPAGIEGHSHQDMLDKWASLKTFQDNWNIDTYDFKSMYADSFANSLTNDLWEGQSFYPKKAMLEFIDQDPDLIRSMFKELFNENLDIEGRIDRFVYHCDELSADMMRSNPKYQSHYHEGYRMISVYLAFRYPMQYCIYDFGAFKTFIEKVKGRSIPSTREIGRFFKVMRTVNTIISKDEELLSMHLALREGRDDLHRGKSLLLTTDFYLFCGNNPL